MPEVPEVQAHAERLTAALAGVELEAFEPLTFTALKTFAPPPSAAIGQPLQAVTRRGKHLLLGMGEVTFVVHLMQGGRLKDDPKPSRKPRGGIARWRFASGQDGPRNLLLTEPGTERKAGVWLVAGDPLVQAPLDALGPEADALDAEALRALFAAHPMRLHGFLRDQRILAGLGRRLANEVCWRAQLSPFASTRSLSADAATAVLTAIHGAVEEGLAVDRARPDMSSVKDRPGAVHDRAGEPCPRCGDAVRAVEYQRYTVDYCPTCQTGGRVLADNTTSKFLK